MSAMDESSLEKSKTWRQWRVTSYNPVGDSWVEHCTGYISTQYAVTSGPVDGGLEDVSESASIEEDAPRRPSAMHCPDHDQL